MKTPAFSVVLFAALALAPWLCAQAPQPPAPTAREAARAAFSAYVVDFWCKGDVSVLARVVSPTLVYHYNGEVVPGGPKDHLEYLRDFGGAFPDLIGTIDQFVFADGTGAAATTWTGTHRGELAGIAATGGRAVPATGRKVTWVVNYVFRLEGGKIVELWESWDEAGLYLRLSRPEEKQSP